MPTARAGRITGPRRRRGWPRVHHQGRASGRDRLGRQGAGTATRTARGIRARDEGQHAAEVRRGRNLGRQFAKFRKLLPEARAWGGCEWPPAAGSCAQGQGRKVCSVRYNGASASRGKNLPAQGALPAEAAHCPRPTRRTPGPRRRRGWPRVHHQGRASGRDRLGRQGAGTATRTARGIRARDEGQHAAEVRRGRNLGRQFAKFRKLLPEARAWGGCEWPPAAGSCAQGQGRKVCSVRYNGASASRGKNLPAQGVHPADASHCPRPGPDVPQGLDGGAVGPGSSPGPSARDAPGRHGAGAATRTARGIRARDEGQHAAEVRRTWLDPAARIVPFAKVRSRPKPHHAHGRPDEPQGLDGGAAGPGSSPGPNAREGPPWTPRRGHEREMIERPASRGGVDCFGLRGREYIF